MTTLLKWVVTRTRSERGKVKCVDASYLPSSSVDFLDPFSCLRKPQNPTPLCIASLRSRASVHPVGVSSVPIRFVGAVAPLVPRRSASQLRFFPRVAAARFTLHMSSSAEVLGMEYIHSTERATFIGLGHGW